MIINLLVDNVKSWIIPYVQDLSEELSKYHQVNFVHDANQIILGDCAFFLGCEKIIKKDVLLKNKHNLVVHESRLPQGKGWSPVTWQILSGENTIPVTLFEAVEAVDAGDIYFQEDVFFNGDELIEEIRKKQAKKTIELINKFIASYPTIKGVRQSGQESFYRKRTPADSEIDTRKTIEEQFNLLRVVDNERYPAFFLFKGHKYIIKIDKAD